ncbi:MAG: methylated-DNA--[protein]-cysteine S-methyltransferase [Chloroflexi bacterium]|nr:MAG: methylated-DNA--[protein]-cysteine S-methyltransferase [Chloroflexota bacterium]
MLHSTTHATPVGELTLVASDRGLRAVVWPKASLRGAGVSGRPHRDPDHLILKTTASQLDEYFAGERTAFDIPLDLEGTRFQVAAWRSLAEIPFGTTTTYGRQAAGLGIPTAARAVGAANGANPVCIVLPCHRVIGSDGSLTGFGGGLPVKQWLLDHEARVLAASSPSPLAGEGRGGGYSIDSTQWQHRLPVQTRLSMPVA